MSELKEYTLDEVSQHTTTESCWLIIGNEKNGEFCLFVFCLCRRLRRRLRHLDVGTVGLSPVYCRTAAV